MHLGNGAITPGCAFVTMAAASAGLGLAALSLRWTNLRREQLLAAGALTGAVFAAQMVNISVLPFSSAHLVGGVLAAWVLGPALGAISMAVVLVCQAVLLGDGGLVPVGANIINMGLVPAGLVWLVRRRPTRMMAGLTAAAAVVASAVLIVGEVALFRDGSQLQGLTAFALQMVGIHLWISLPEGLLTVAILMALGWDHIPGQLRLDSVRLAGCWGTAALLIMSVLPFASQMPDGYEASAARSGMSILVTQDRDEIASIGQVNAAVAVFQDKVVTSFQSVLAGDQMLALVSTCCAGLAAYGVARFLARRATKLA